MYTVEPPYSGHFGTVLTCPLYEGVPLNWEVKIYCKYTCTATCTIVNKISIVNYIRSYTACTHQKGEKILKIIL